MSEQWISGKIITGRAMDSKGSRPAHRTCVSVPSSMMIRPVSGSNCTCGASDGRTAAASAASRDSSNSARSAAEVVVARRFFFFRRAALQQRNVQHYKLRLDGARARAREREREGARERARERGSGRKKERGGEQHTSPSISSACHAACPSRSLRQASSWAPSVRQRSRLVLPPPLHLLLLWLFLCWAMCQPLGLLSTPAVPEPLLSRPARLPPAHHSPLVCPTARRSH